MVSLNEGAPEEKPSKEEVSEVIEMFDQAFARRDGDEKPVDETVEQIEQKYSAAWDLINSSESTAEQILQLKKDLAAKYNDEILGGKSVPEEWRTRRVKIKKEMVEKANKGEDFKALMKEYNGLDASLDTPDFKNYREWKKEKDYLEQLFNIVDHTYDRKTGKTSF
ncbi:MAG: hypothetical protein V4438_02710 [Patescibacteria group bacterium]